MIDRTELAARRDGLVKALNERSRVVQSFDCEAPIEAGNTWEAPTLEESERIADFVIDYLAGGDAN